MKTCMYALLACVTVVFFILSCAKEKENATQLDFSGKMLGHSACKSSKSAFMPVTADTLSCVAYAFDVSTNRLFLQHINAGFNCCPDSLFCEVTIRNDTIVVQEFETKQQCNCDCLYDLDMEIEGVKPQEYMIRFIEPYCGSQEQIIFGADFSDQKEGVYCVTRKQYPWGN